MTMGRWDVGGSTANCLSEVRRLYCSQGVLQCGPSSGEQSCRAVAGGFGRVVGFIGGGCAEPVVVREARDITC
jgi:xanthine dehydrogenase accessory factor